MFGGPFLQCDNPIVEERGSLLCFELRCFIKFVLLVISCVPVPVMPLVGNAVNIDTAFFAF